MPSKRFEPMTNTYITGVGISDFGRMPEMSEETLARVAIHAALRDAGRRADEIDAFYCGNVFGQNMPGQRALREVAGVDGRPIFNIDNACASGASAMHLALQAIGSGECETALVFGMDQLSALGGGTIPLGTSDWNVRRGMVMPALYAMRAVRYLHEHQLDVSVLADVSVKNRRHGLLNPIARFCKPASREEVLASRPVADPLTLLQCCPGVVDGAAAVVLDAKPRKGEATPVRVLASVIQSGRFEPGCVDMTEAEITARSAKLAYEQAGLAPSDVNVVELHDAFTISELLYYEALQLCPRGEAADFLRSGATALGGRVPVNPSGGLLAKGHPPGATGVAQLVELCEQLQRRAGRRQVPGARIGLAQVTGGGIWGMDHAACGVHILAA
jgi:acetyl-CoA acetyltransferase